jgi:biopolymer transport protein ExbB/TolQ
MNTLTALLFITLSIYLTLSALVWVWKMISKFIRVKRAMKKLEKSIQKAKPNMDKIESVDEFMKEMREL